jgi:hypothetical protein
MIFVNALGTSFFFFQAVYYNKVTIWEYGFEAGNQEGNKLSKMHTTSSYLPPINTFQKDGNTVNYCG